MQRIYCGYICQTANHAVPAVQAHGSSSVKLLLQDYAERRALRSELRSLSKEERQRQQKAVEEVLKRASVVCATLTGVATFQLRGLTFDVTVVDEAAQVSQPELSVDLLEWLGCWNHTRDGYPFEQLQRVDFFFCNHINACLQRATVFEYPNEPILFSFGKETLSEMVRGCGSQQAVSWHASRRFLIVQGHASL